MGNEPVKVLLHCISNELLEFLNDQSLPFQQLWCFDIVNEMWNANTFAIESYKYFDGTMTLNS